MRKNIHILTISVFIYLFLAGTSLADEGNLKIQEETLRKLEDKSQDESKTLQGIEVLTGFSYSQLHYGKDYEFIPINLSFDFNLKAIYKNIEFKPLLQFQIEPFLSIVTKPNTNIESGTTFWLKVGFVPDTRRIQPYGKLGLGLIYMTQHLAEQSTQFNFTQQGALGLEFSLTKSTALIIEGRARHLSNAGIKHPNHGINSYFGLTGISYKF